MKNLGKWLFEIQPIDELAVAAARQRQGQLTKPAGSLGRLEDIACRIAGITGQARPSVDKKRIVLFAGDHGVARDGVSAYPREVTPQMVLNILGGGAAINAIAASVGAEVEVVDVGVDADFKDAPGLIQRKIAKGTANISQGPAMSLEQALAALAVGVERAQSAVQDKVNLLGTGDMGIGNTTPSAALFAALLRLPVSQVTGRGTGLDDENLRRKVKVIEQALEINQKALIDPLACLAALGGFEIAGLCGLIIGAAKNRVPVVIDGFISSAAALVAIRLKPVIRQYCFFGHLSQEQGHQALFKELGEPPLLDLGLRLGEGTGAALAMSLIQAGVDVHNKMATFETAGVSNKEG
jgi:nicotinate-nucleotide--dimethylbenzimidazole phosphoribosyltransferase